MQFVGDIACARFWNLIVHQQLGVERALSDKLLKAIQKHRTPECLALLFHLRRLLHAGPESLDAMFDGCMQPNKMVFLIEQIAEHNLLTRIEANQAQEAFLSMANREGKWKEM